MIKALIVDFGNVIYKERWDVVMQEINKSHNLDFKTFNNAFIKFWDDYKIGKIEPWCFWYDVLNELKIEPHGDNIRAFSRAFKNIWGEADENLLAFLKGLKPNVRIFGLTNSCLENEERIVEDLKKLEFFDKIYMSHKHGIKKPDDEAYLFIVEENKLKPENFLLVDDKERNTNGALKLGFNVHVYENLNKLLLEAKKYGL